MKNCFIILFIILNFCSFSFGFNHPLYYKVHKDVIESKKAALKNSSSRDQYLANLKELINAIEKAFNECGRDGNFAKKLSAKLAKYNEDRQKLESGAGLSEMGFIPQGLRGVMANRAELEKLQSRIDFLIQGMAKANKELERLRKEKGLAEDKFDAETPNAEERYFPLNKEPEVVCTDTVILAKLESCKNRADCKTSYSKEFLDKVRIAFANIKTKLESIDLSEVKKNKMIYSNKLKNLIEHIDELLGELEQKGNFSEELGSLLEQVTTPQQMIGGSLPPLSQYLPELEPLIKETQQQTLSAEKAQVTLDIRQERLLEMLFDLRSVHATSYDDEQYLTLINFLNDSITRTSKPIQKVKDIAVSINNLDFISANKFLSENVLGAGGSFRVKELMPTSKALQFNAAFWQEDPISTVMGTPSIDLTPFTRLFHSYRFSVYVFEKTPIPPFLLDKGMTTGKDALSLDFNGSKAFTERANAIGDSLVKIEEKDRTSEQKESITFCNRLKSIYDQKKELVRKIEELGQLK